MSRARAPAITSASTLMMEVEPALRGLRDSFARLVQAAPGPVHRAVDLRRALGLGAELSWQVFRVATALDPGLVGPFVPKPGSLRRLLQAAEAAGVPRAVNQGVQSAYDEYERLIAHHAGDRAGFDAIVEGVGAAGPGGIALKDRRAAFRANRNIWGVQAGARVATLIVVPDNARDAVDSVMLGALADLYAVRPAATLSLQLWAQVKDTDTGQVLSSFQSTDSDEPWESLGLLRSFSTPTLPPLTMGVRSDGTPHATLTLPGVGRSSAVTLYYAHATPRGTSKYSHRFGAYVLRPCEVMVMDILIARSDESIPRDATGSVYARIDEVNRAFERRPEDKLPWNIPVATIGPVRAAAPIPEVPQYVPAVASVLERYGWAGREFDLYRLRVEYPILHTVVHLSLSDPAPQTADVAS